MISSGQLSLIKNSNLNLEVIDYSLFIEDNELEFITNIDNIFFKQVFPILNKVTQVELDEYYLDKEDKNLQQKRKETASFINLRLSDSSIQLALENAIKIKLHIHSSHLSIIEETKEGAKELTKLVEKELNEHIHD